MAYQVREPKWTRPGENKRHITLTAYAFSQVKTTILTCPAAAVKNIPDPLSSNPLLAGDDANSAWTTLVAFFSKKGNQERRKWLIRIGDAGLDPLFCTEADLRTLLFKYFVDRVTPATNNDKSRKKPWRPKTITNACTHIRRALFAIGRESPWNDGNSPTYDHFGRQLVNAGNPMTKRLAEIVGSAAQSAWTGPRLTIGPANARVGEGKPAPVTLFFALAMIYLDAACDMFKRATGTATASTGEPEPKSPTPSDIMPSFVGKPGAAVRDPAPLRNLLQTVMLIMFVIHEGCRPGEVLGVYGTNAVLGGLHHSDLWFTLHERVYWLTLVFLRPKTLRYVLTNAHTLFGAHVTRRYKGKEAQCAAAPLVRTKAVIPAPYAALDLVWIYVTCMRMLLAVDPEALSASAQPPASASLVMTPVFAKQASKKLGEYTAKLGIYGCTYYSARYSAALEDSSIGIDEKWTRARMGHKKASKTAEEYAKVAKGGKATIGGAECRLGSERYVMGDDTVEFVTRDKATLDKSWATRSWPRTPDSLSDDDLHELREDFLSTAKIVKAWIEAPESTTIDSLKPLLKRLRKAAKRGALLSEIPIGLNVELAPGLLSQKITARYEDAAASLKTHFAPIASDTTVALSLFSQLIYGRWQRPNGAAEAEVEVEAVDEPKAETNDEANESSDYGSDTDADVEANVEANVEADVEADDVDDDAPTTAFAAPKIPLFRDQLVVLFTDEPDDDAFRLPNDRAVWVVKVTSFAQEDDMYCVTGRFLSGRARLLDSHATFGRWSSATPSIRFIDPKITVLHTFSDLEDLTPEVVARLVAATNDFPLSQHARRWLKPRKRMPTQEQMSDVIAANVEANVEANVIASTSEANDAIEAPRTSRFGRQIKQKKNADCVNLEDYVY